MELDLHLWCNEIKVLQFILELYTKENYNEIAEIIKQRLDKQVQAAKGVIE